MKKRKRIECSETGSSLGFLGFGYDKLACIPDYDAGKPEKTPSGKRVIRFHGDATYEVVNRCEYGCGYHCRLIWSRRYYPGATTKSQIAYKARVEALLGH